MNADVVLVGLCPDVTPSRQNPVLTAKRRKWQNGGSATSVGMSGQMPSSDRKAPPSRQNPVLTAEGGSGRTGVLPPRVEPSDALI